MAIYDNLETGDLSIGSLGYASLWAYIDSRILICRPSNPQSKGYRHFLDFKI